MKSLLKLLLFSGLLFLTSCATIISGSRQTIKISSTPSAATIFINEVEVGKTPLEKSLKRNQDYQLLLKLDGYEPYETIISKEFNAWYLGNIVFGGIIGLIIDPITGAMHKLTPENLHTHLSNKVAFKTVDKNIYIAVSMEIDPNWEKVGQLVKN